MARQGSTPPIHLDGTTLEGGGQLLRLALSLSSLTHIPIRITDIRGKRGPISCPGKDGGLKPAHLAAVKWLAQATEAETEGMQAKSKELTFRPTRPRVEPTGQDSSKEQATKTTSGQYLGVWKDVSVDGELIERTSHITVSTPGSIPLVLQAILPYLLFAPSAIRDHQDRPVPLRIKIDGGTNVSKSPSIEYVSQVFLPMLSMKLGIPAITTTLHKRGWSTGGTQIGSVSFDVVPFRRGHVLPAFNLENRGELASVYVSILAPNENARDKIRDNVIAQLLAFDPEVEIQFSVDEDSRNEKRWYLLLVAETSSGYRLGCDWLYDLKTKGIKTEEICAKLVSKVVNDLKREMNHGGCVDEYMQDQLVVFQALADGQATVDAGKQQASLHTRAAKWVAGRILGVNFKQNGNCEGVRFCVGEDFERQMENVESPVEEMAGLQI